MMNEEVEILAAIENMENNVQEHQREVHTYRNGFDVSDNKFIKTYRLTKELTRELINIIRPFVVQRQRMSGLTVEEKRCVEEITTALNHPELLQRYVKFPETLNEMNSLRMRFHRIYGMPGIIGCIDCTHIAIVPPKTNDPVHPERIYVNRKNYHSLNVQLVCDERMKILHVNPRFPGSSHDSHIWNNSNIEPVLRNIHERGNGGYFLLGDSGYPLRPWLLTPVANAETEEEEAYNEVHRRARSTIERCNGLLKMRFRCLLKHRVLHYAPNKASKIINACVLLHNMCIDNNVELNLEGMKLTWTLKMTLIMISILKTLIIIFN
ncbi:hypothetical protein NQ314_021153 [Rhamnusium bicolor]|uniref:DDE Tnp4 domain-containing protein n=1 Tax=Rhamnusium bicolor TaxID=1586634 RepID=A0AAV8WJC6_9CUCU|nr:hypothetical protein NQ314_021153 [Rhamnusium bicolor]